MGVERSFKPTELPEGKEITVWRWLEKGVKLWRVIFDDSRKERGSLMQKWDDAKPKYQKCAYLTRCYQYPETMLSLEAEKDADKKKQSLKTTCKEYCREVAVRAVDCTNPEGNRLCDTPLLDAGLADRLL